MPEPIRAAEPSQIYFSHQLDTARWKLVNVRDGDIIIATPPKSGTTWMQRIVSVLVLGNALPAPLSRLSPWIDCRFVPPPVFDQVLQSVEAQHHRRFLKSHLPFDGLPYDPRVRYVYVSRDARDAALSLQAFLSDTAEPDPASAPVNQPPGLFKELLDTMPRDIHTFIKRWLTEPNPAIPWQQDGYPIVSHFYHARSYWDQRALPNLLLVHYNDLKTDFIGEITRLARFLGIEPTEERLKLTEHLSSFAAMKDKAEALIPDIGTHFKSGARRMFNKGVSGGWKAVFTPEELELYKAAVKRNLTPDCARWLEQGRLASGIDPSKS